MSASAPSRNCTPRASRWWSSSAAPTTRSSRRCGGSACRSPSPTRPSPRFYDLHVPAAAGPLTGRPVAALAAELRFAPLALTGGDGTARPVAPQTTLTAGDRLTVILAQPDLQRLLQRAAVDEAPAPSA